MDLGLSGKVAFVAGGSRGIGLAVVRGFLAEGAKVVMTGRNDTSLQSSYGVLAQDGYDERIMAIQGDLTDVAQIEHALGETVKKFGRLDVVVANIGSGTAKSGFQLDRHDWDSVFASNLFGSIHLAREALTYMVDAGSGSLIFIASIAGIEAIGAPVPYGAAKAALMMAMKSYACQVGREGVRVNAVAPGNIVFPGGTWAKKLEEREAFFKNYIEAEVPMKRFGKPEEIADAVIFLASERASFITGTVLVADGGQVRSYV